MKWTNTLVAPIATAMLLSGCANLDLMNQVSVGQSKSNVIEKLGEPDIVRATKNIEYLNYTLYSKGRERLCVIGGVLTAGFLAMACIAEPNVYVRLENDKVTSFGRIGDFNTTSPDRLEVEHSIR